MYYRGNMARYLATTGTSRKTSKGFTLVELSIVIVIVGLIVAGVTAGNSLVRSSKMNKVLGDIKKYDIAYTTFKLQYGGLPGDLRNAESFFGTYNASTNPTGVQNGNGDRYICCSDSTHPESMQSWAHLSRAKLIEGVYTGQGSAVIGVTHPVSPYHKSASFWPAGGFACNSSGCGGAIQPAKRGNVLNFTGIGWWGWIDYMIAVKDASDIDKKIDDGIPDSGNFSCFNYLSFSGVNMAPCATYRTSYNISNGTRCTCQFLLTSR